MNTAETGGFRGRRAIYHGLFAVNPGEALASTRPGVYAAIMSALLDRLYHLHWVTGQVARCAQPYLGFYAAFLRPHGFKSLINLRGENADFRWWWLPELVSSSATFVPPDLALLLPAILTGDYPAEPRAIGI